MYSRNSVSIQSVFIRKQGWTGSFFCVQVTDHAMYSALGSAHKSWSRSTSKSACGNLCRHQSPLRRDLHSISIFSTGAIVFVCRVFRVTGFVLTVNVMQRVTKSKVVFARSIDHDAIFVYVHAVNSKKIACVMAALR